MRSTNASGALATLWRTTLGNAVQAVLTLTARERFQKELKQGTVEFVNSMVDCGQSNAGDYFLPTIRLDLTCKSSIPNDVLDAFELLGRHSTIPAAERKRQAVRAENRTRGRTFVTRSIVSAEINRFLRRVDRQLGSAYRRRRAQLGCSFSLEGGARSKELHGHGWIEIPPGMPASRFVRLLRETWLQSIWALPITRVSVTRNQIATTIYNVKGGIENVDVFNTRRSTTCLG